MQSTARILQSGTIAYNHLHCFQRIIELLTLTDVDRNRSRVSGTAEGKVPGKLAVFRMVTRPFPLEVITVLRSTAS